MQLPEDFIIYHSGRDNCISIYSAWFWLGFAGALVSAYFHAQEIYYQPYSTHCYHWRRSEFGRRTTHIWKCPWNVDIEGGGGVIQSCRQNVTKPQKEDFLKLHRRNISSFSIHSRWYRKVPRSRLHSRSSSLNDSLDENALWSRSSLWSCKL